MKTLDAETKKIADKIYKVGVKNGGILMKNKILKKLNRDWTLRPIDTVIKILKIINKIK
jgi:hypothetical protein